MNSLESLPRMWLFLKPGDEYDPLEISLPLERRERPGIRIPEDSISYLLPLGFEAREIGKFQEFFGLSETLDIRLLAQLVSLNNHLLEVGGLRTQARSRSYSKEMLSS